MRRVREQDSRLGLAARPRARRSAASGTCGRSSTASPTCRRSRVDAGRVASFLALRAGLPRARPRRSTPPAPRSRPPATVADAARDRWQQRPHPAAPPSSCSLERRAASRAPSSAAPREPRARRDRRSAVASQPAPCGWRCMSVADVTSRIQQIQSQLAHAARRSAPPAATPVQRADGRQRRDAGTVTAAAPAPASPGDAVVAEAKKYLGLPYVWGGTDPEKGLDCSGLVQQVYKKLGFDLPRVSAEQAAAGRAGREPGRGPARRPDRLGQLQPQQRRRPHRDLHRQRQDDRGAAHRAERADRRRAVHDPDRDPPDPPRRRLAAPQPVAGGSAPPVAGRARRTPTCSTRRRRKYGVERRPARRRRQAGVRLQPEGRQPRRRAGPDAADAGHRQGPRRQNSFDPTQAVDGAARLLRDLLDRFGSTDLALAAYNAGPGAVLPLRRHPAVPRDPELRPLRHVDAGEAA